MSGPHSGVRRAQGGIYAVVKMLDKKHGSFFISRLILMTGINVRSFDQTSYDDPVIVSKIVKALQSCVAPGELETLLPLLSVQR